MPWASLQDFSAQMKANLNGFFLPFPTDLHLAFLVLVLFSFSN